VKEDDTSKGFTPTRRRFLKAGALLAAPIAVASVSAVARAEEGLKTHVKHLEDEAEIRELHQSWLRRVNAGQRDPLLDGAVRRITAHHAGAPDKIEVAADGRTAVGSFDYAVDAETLLAEDCTLAQMAYAQGHGTLLRTERRMFAIEYVKSDGTWKIGNVASRISDDLSL
jgi:hypothetical protein